MIPKTTRLASSLFISLIGCGCPPAANNSAKNPQNRSISPFKRVVNAAGHKDERNRRRDVRRLLSGQGPGDVPAVELSYWEEV
jgi:hypothetical protein